MSDLSRDMEKEIDEVIKTITSYDPTYEISNTHSSKAIKVNKIYTVNINSTSIFSNIIKNSTYCKLNKQTSLHYLHHDRETILYNMQRHIINEIKDFLTDHQNKKNNKLTRLYKWYNHFLIHDSMNDSIQFENDMFNVAKWLKEIKKVKETAQDGVVVLIALQNRYELKGWKL